jgi:hypothetical protein
MVSGYIHQGLSKEEIQARNTLPYTRIKACLKIHAHLHGKGSLPPEELAGQNAKRNFRMLQDSAKAKLILNTFYRTTSGQKREIVHDSYIA